MSDKTRLLALFRRSNGRLISSSEMIDGKFDSGKRIIEYTGRLKDARDAMGCTCGDDPKRCVSGEHIVNVKTNWYQYQSTRVIRDEEIPTLKPEKPDYKKMRELLVIEYKKESDPFKKQLITQKGLALKSLIEQQEQSKELISHAEKALL